MEFLLLGPLVVRDDAGRELPLRRRQQRALLSILLLFANEVVSRERLIDVVWSERPPPTATTALQGHVSQLRKLLGSERLVTEGSGYRLRPRVGEVDLARFESLLAEAKGLGEPAGRVERLRTALSLWRGRPLAEFESEPFARAEVSRLAELRLVALEERTEAELELGAAVELVPELESLVAAEPYRERLRAQLMLALYRSGRQVESLAVYRAGRALLVDELGIDPSPRLRELEQAILRQDPALDPPAVAQPLAAETEPPPPAAEPAREVRKTVTVLFSDLVDFTRLASDLDPEALRHVMSTYFAEMAAVLERHGGTVEKYIGDAIMAVFGIPVLHEDDALRAVRAADEMRHALDALNEELDRARGVRLEARAGIATGEVLAGDASLGQPFATGGAVVVAKRLEEGAGAGEILVDENTYQLVRDAVRAEPAGELDSRTTGKAQSALRIVEVAAADRGRARRLDTPLVGRERQLALLRTSFANAVTDRTCHLFTILGVAGVGKSRLVHEFVSALGAGVTVLRGRCLPYGEGITYWPLAEVVREAAGVDAESEEQAVTMIAAQLAGEENAGLIATRVGEVVGLGGPTAGTSEETFWAVRKLFEGVAHRRPLIVVLDDLQWAEPTFIELVEHIADFSRDAPMLLLCMGRPELIDGYPGWGGGKLNASSFLLEPLDAGESHQLISNLLDGPVEADVAERIIEVSEGNPLFTEELLAMLVEDGLLEWRGGSWAPSAELTVMPVPASIHSLLAARLERLPDEERTLIERAAVEGAVFHRGSVSELCPEALRPTLERSLMALVRKDVIRPERADFPGEYAFRFRHGLIRDAAYRSLPKKTRAALHERFADWLERVGGPRPREFEEIVGYHLEQAYRYHGDLHAEDRGDLASRAAYRLESAGRRAISRMDLSAAENLLERAAPLLPRDDSRRAALHAALGGVLIDAGKLDKAAAVLAEGRRAATAAADACAEAHVLVQQAFLELQRPAVDGTEEAARVVERVVPIFERYRDERGRCNARRLEAWVYHHRGRGEAAAEAWEHAAKHARTSGDEHARAEILTWVAAAMFYGPTRVHEGIRRCEQIRADVSGDRACEAATLRHLAALHAMDGRFELARELLGTAHAIFAELGLSLHSAVAYSEATVEMLAGRPDAAEALLRAGYEALDAMGERGILSTVAAVLARTLLEQERDREAEQFTELADELAASGDLLTHMVWRGVRARILAKRGQMVDAERFAREAVAIAEQTDFLNDRAAALLDLGEVLATAERLDEARATVAEAVALYERKGNVVSTRAVRLRLPKHTAV